MASKQLNGQASLASLPPELLDEIVEAMDWEGCESAINSLARTNRTFYQSLVRSLYRKHSPVRQRFLTRWAIDHSRLGTLQKAVRLGVDLMKLGPVLIWAIRGSSLPVIHYLSKVAAADNSGVEWKSAILYKVVVSPIRWQDGHGVALAKKLMDEHDLDVDSCITPGITPLVMAILRDDTEMAEFLLSRNASVDIIIQRFSGLGSLMRLAAGRGQLALARALLDRGFSPHRSPQRNTGRKPIHAAARNGDIQMLRLLLERGGDIEARGYKCLTPLSEAAFTGHAHVVEELLDRGADIHSNEGSGESPLARACKGGFPVVAELLLRRGARMDHKLPLIVHAVTSRDSSEESSVQVIRVLLKHGANVNEREPGGSSMFDVALDYGCVEIARLLIEHGAEQGAKRGQEIVDSNGMTPLIRFVLRKVRNLDHMITVLRKGENIMATWRGGLTALHFAARHDNAGLMKLLLQDPGIDIKQPDNNGRTPFFYAAMRGDGRVLKLLITRFVSSISSTEGEEFDKSLRSCGNFPDIFGTMPIIAAARNGRRTAVKKMLKVDRNSFHVKDAQGRGLLWWAEASNDPANISTAALIRRFAQQNGFEYEEPQLMKGFRRLDNASKGSFFTCSVCTRISVRKGASYRCTVCDDGKFFICEECIDCGASCRGAPGVHDLVMCLRPGKE